MAYYIITCIQTGNTINKEFLNEQNALKWVQSNLNPQHDYAIAYNYQLNTPN